MRQQSVFRWLSCGISGRGARASVRTALAAMVVSAASLMAFADQAEACPDWGLNGPRLNYSGQDLWQPRSVGVTAWGQWTLSNCAAPGGGYVRSVPDYELNLTGNPQRYDLDFSVQGQCDTVLLINDATGQWHFNDDGAGNLQPRIRLSQAQPGTYDIWVGTYGPSSCSATLTMETFGGSAPPPPQPPTPQPPIASSCPDWRLSGTPLRYSAASLAAPQSVGVTAGGNTSLSNCPDVRRTGWVTQSPDFELTLSGAAGQELDMRVQAACDTVLLVNDANGQWHFDDDSGGSLNPRLRFPSAANGVYDIWVGTYGRSTCAATLTLQTVSGFTPQPPAPQPPTPQPPTPAACPDWRLQGGPLSLTSGGLTSGALYSVTAGGPARPGECNIPGGRGYVSVAPTVELTFSGNAGASRALEIRAQATCDTVLLVNDASGNWLFNDDADGSLNSRIRIEAARDGVYDIWVGSYGSAGCQATLGLQTFGASVAPPPPQPQPPQPQPPAQGQARLLGVYATSSADYVGRGEAMSGNGQNDARFRVGVAMGGEILNGVEIRSTGGIFSVWDTLPGNGHWSTAVVIGGRHMNPGPGIVYTALGGGETVIDLYAEQNGAIGNAGTGFRITLSFASGATRTIDVPAGFLTP